MTSSRSSANSSSSRCECVSIMLWYGVSKYVASIYVCRLKLLEVSCIIFSICVREVGWQRHAVALSSLLPPEPCRGSGVLQQRVPLSSVWQVGQYPIHYINV